MASCSTPPSSTPQARARTGGSNQGAATVAARIRDTFSSTGVKAGTEKRLQVLSTPAARATRDMKAM